MITEQSVIPVSRRKPHRYHRLYTEATVLIQGESGTRKEMIAEAVHQDSPRRERWLIGHLVVPIRTALLEVENRPVGGAP